MCFAHLSAIDFMLLCTCLQHIPYTVNLHTTYLWDNKCKSVPVRQAEVGLTSSISLNNHAFTVNRLEVSGSGLHLLQNILKHTNFRQVHVLKFQTIKSCLLDNHQGTMEFLICIYFNFFENHAI